MTSDLFICFGVRDQLRSKNSKLRSAYNSLTLNIVYGQTCNLHGSLPHAHSVLLETPAGARDERKACWTRTDSPKANTQSCVMVHLLPTLPGFSPYT